MNFHLTEEQLAVKEAAREFAQKELKPGVIERDSSMEYPAEQVRRMAELGFRFIFYINREAKSRQYCPHF